MKKTFTVFLFLVLVGLVILPAYSLVAEDLEKAFADSYTAESEGRIDDAYNIIDSAIGAERTVYAGVMRLAYLKSLAGKYSLAAELYNSAAELEPNAVEPLLYLQYQYILLGDWQGLEQSSNKALKNDLNNYLSMTRLAYSYYQRGQYGRAREAYLKVQQLYPLELDAMVMVGWSNALSNHKSEAKRNFRKVLMLAPQNKSAKEGLAFATR